MIAQLRGLALPAPGELGAAGWTNRTALVRPRQNGGSLRKWPEQHRLRPMGVNDALDSEPQFGRRRGGIVSVPKSQSKIASVLP